MEPTGVHLLMVEDNPDDAYLVRAALTEVAGESFRITQVGRLGDAEQRLRVERFDVILLDLSLPDAQGLEGLTQLQTEAPSVPIVVLTGNLDESQGVAAIQAGAQDYCFKDAINGRALALVIRYTVERKRSQMRQEAAEAANRAKDTFLAHMSHELRTPLNGVLTMTELLLGTRLDDQQRRYAELARFSGDALLSLINNILDFSKIEAQRVELERVDFDLPNLVEGVAASFGPTAEEKGLELVCSLHPQVPRRCRGDPGRLRQILTNLMNNAIKFTPTGEVVVRAALEEQRNGGLVLRFTVADTGIGIAPDRVNRLFHPFSQADAGTARKYGGTGLGLAICRRLVELMEGQIGLASESVRGSTFWFTVRLEKSSPPDEESPRVPEELRETRVLVVDDHASQREAVRERLVAWGLDCRVASDAPQGLATLREAAFAGRPFGFALLDRQMPGMDGEQLARAIKADPALRSTVLVLLTTMSRCHDADGMRRLGFAGWLTKPVRHSQLWEMLVETVASAPGCGTAVGRERRWDLDTTGQDGVPERRAPARILVVEDNAISREAAATILRHAGYECDVAADGRQAVEAALSRGYDAILMDCQLPDLDGFEATRIIRRHEVDGSLPASGAGRLPIIALTASAVKGDRERCLQAGMDDYVTKPFCADRLLHVLRSNLACSESQEAPHEDAAATRASGTPADLPEPFDVATLRRQWRCDAAAAGKLIRTFQEQARLNLEQLGLAVASKDAARTAEIAHGLTGAAAYVSADRAQSLAAELETLGRSADLSTAGECWARLAEELRCCLAYVPDDTPARISNESSPVVGGAASKDVPRNRR